MLCQICGKNQASIFIREITLNRKHPFGVCLDCAQKCATESETVRDNPAIASILANLGDFQGGLGEIMDTIGEILRDSLKPAQQKNDSTPCPTCGWILPEIEKIHSFSCPDCIRTFADKLEGTLYNKNRALLHTGKIPPRDFMDNATDTPDGDTGGETPHTKVDDELLTMRKALDEAVRREEYEYAAVLRDKITALENPVMRGE